MQERRSNAERSHNTRRLLLEAAREIFVEKGYASTGTPEVVARADLTRGALYHHFSDKQALFRAVIETEAAQIAAEINESTTDSQTPQGALLEGARAFLAAMRVPGRVRLMLIEGPAALGPHEMRQIDMETGGRELRLGIAEALGPGASPSVVAVIADLVSAMFDRAALAADTGSDGATYADALASLISVLVQRGIQTTDQ